MDSEISGTMLLITANVGTIFENLDELLQPWLNELTKRIEECEPEFMALHLQEVGGKNYKQTMQLITPFFKKLLFEKSLHSYDRLENALTKLLFFLSKSLCNIYLIHESVKENDIELYSFSEKSFSKYAYRRIFSGSLKSEHLFYRERFKKDFFKEFQWSRKGFVQTKWKIRNNESRKKALDYSIRRILSNHHDLTRPIMYFVFGDFNFRLDLASLVNDYSKRSHSIELKDDENKLMRLVCKSDELKDIMTIEEKKFKWHFDQSIQTIWKNFFKYDIELALIDERLYEQEKTFPPTYPFMEEREHPDEYMESRCPAWCDRIIFNANLKQFLDWRAAKIEYGMIGQGVCMGDHKPIYLSINLSKTNDRAKREQRPTNEKHSHVILNENFVNMNSESIDIHDFALFKHFSPLLPLQIEHSSFYFGSGSSNNGHMNLNELFASLVELQLKIAHSSLDNYANLLNNNNNNNNNSTEDLSHFSMHFIKDEKALLDSSAFIQFFLHTLNGNLFRLKCLLEFVNSLVEKFDLSNQNHLNASECVKMLHDCEEASTDLCSESIRGQKLSSTSFERMIFVLAKFLRTNFVFELVKNAIRQHNSNTREHDENFNNIH